MKWRLLWPNLVAWKWNWNCEMENWNRACVCVCAVEMGEQWNWIFLKPHRTWFVRKLKSPKQLWAELNYNDSSSNNSSASGNYTIKRASFHPQPGIAMLLYGPMKIARIIIYFSTVSHHRLQSVAFELVVFRSLWHKSSAFATALYLENAVYVYCVLLSVSIKLDCAISIIKLINAKMRCCCVAAMLNEPFILCLCVCGTSKAAAKTRSWCVG